MHEATLRPRSHGDASASRGIARPGDATAELKRRRANVLFVLVLTTVCAGFLAATTDSKATVYVFALSMLALGGYVYLLVTMNQREMYARGYEAEFRSPQQGRPASRDERWDFDDLDEYGGYDRPAPRQAAAKQRQVVQPPADRQAQYAADFPGAGVSGRISYGRGPAARQAAHEPRDPYGRDGYGWETAGRDPSRRAPARNGRHATGQQQAVRRRHYSQAG